MSQGQVVAQATCKLVAFLLWNFLKYLLFTWDYALGPPTHNVLEVTKRWELAGNKSCEGGRAGHLNSCLTLQEPGNPLGD